MLTSLFYYNYYKPYLIGGTTSVKDNTFASRMKTAYARDESDTRTLGSSLQRNVALKNDVVNYARSFSNSVTGLKGMAHALVKNSESIKLAAHTEGMSDAIEWVEEDLTDFAESFNQAKRFAESQVHSRGVQNLAEDITNDFYGNAEILGRIGLKVSPDGDLSFSSEKIEDYTYGELSDALENLKELAQVIYDKTTDFLQKPLSEHMNFRPLNYYYSYKLGTIYNNPFQLVDSGMLVDITV